MCIFHKLQCKIKSKINPVWIKLLKTPTVDNFHLINSSKWYHVYKNPTIHILDMKYGHYGSNTLMIELSHFICVFLGTRPICWYNELWEELSTLHSFSLMDSTGILKMLNNKHLTTYMDMYFDEIQED
jgi:hypothetical protein